MQEPPRGPAAPAAVGLCSRHTAAEDDAEAAPEHAPVELAEEWHGVADAGPHVPLEHPAAPVLVEQVVDAEEGKLPRPILWLCLDVGPNDLHHGELHLHPHVGEPARGEYAHRQPDGDAVDAIGVCIMARMVVCHVPVGQVREDVVLQRGSWIHGWVPVGLCTTTQIAVMIECLPSVGPGNHKAIDAAVELVLLEEQPGPANVHLCDVVLSNMRQAALQLHVPDKPDPSALRFVGWFDDSDLPLPLRLKAGPVVIVRHPVDLVLATQELQLQLVVQDLCTCESAYVGQLVRWKLLARIEDPIPLQ
mmetsp:Transcript_5869/g.17472  ORF Transcript_5869/g.17472 Transcript_5869/m.17472 type:complete len:305 (+) Transcript_5869:337-1251(+)|eukprot:CAMPEP_0175233564 /NCGR_PEP_ID=MMETSP0093-20121207/26534_1 /TAXON_ID=311494 /ORGANISM="Alexandrium monilatum, Strain CCMP3105" /LENGTH=304 /DNA_ID=CAMNT_0016527445 /DNA_START=311 /DNA_END=1225 /DNA_ORIENTATION=+